MSRSEIFREFTRYLNADHNDFGRDEEMFRAAGIHMRKADRQEMVDLLLDLEKGKLSCEEIQTFWDGSGARFYIIGEESVRNFLYRARHVLEQSLFLPDIEDLRAGRTLWKSKPATQLSASNNRAFLRLAQHFQDIQRLDPDLTKDRRRLLLEKLTPEDVHGLKRLVADVANGSVTENVLQSQWTVSGQPHFPGKLTGLVFGAARILDAAGKGN